MPARAIGRRTARCKSWQDRSFPLGFRSFGPEETLPSPQSRKAPMKLWLNRTAKFTLRVSEPLHEPTHPRPLPGGEQTIVRAARVPLLGGVRGGFMVPMHAQKRMEAFHEPAAVPPGFGVRQSSGAFRSGPRAQKRQRTAAVQDASTPAAASSRFMVPMHAQERKEALHERRPLPALPRPKRERGWPKAGRGGTGGHGPKACATPKAGSQSNDP